VHRAWFGPYGEGEGDEQRVEVGKEVAEDRPRWKGKGESLWLGDEKTGYLEEEELNMVEVGKGGQVPMVSLTPYRTHAHRSVMS
jgi:hypothetical protein